MDTSLEVRRGPFNSKFCKASVFPSIWYGRWCFIFWRGLCPRHPNTCWEGIRTPKICQEHLLRKGMFSKKGSTWWYFLDILGSADGKLMVWGWWFWVYEMTLWKRLLLFRGTPIRGQAETQKQRIVFQPSIIRGYVVLWGVVGVVDWRNHSMYKSAWYYSGGVG